MVMILPYALTAPVFCFLTDEFNHFWVMIQPSEDVFDLISKLVKCQDEFLNIFLV